MKTLTNKHVHRMKKADLNQVMMHHP